MLLATSPQSVKNGSRLRVYDLMYDKTHLLLPIISERDTKVSQVHLMICGEEDLRSRLIIRRKSPASLIYSF